MNRALRHLVTERLRSFLREPETVFWTFFFPALLAVVLGIAFRGPRLSPPLAVVVEGAGAAGVARALAADDAMRVKVLPRGEAAERLRSGRADILVVPGRPVVYRYDPARQESLLARAKVNEALQRAAGSRDPVPVADEAVREPGGRYIDFLVPGLLGMNLMSSGLWGLGWAIVEMRKRKFLKLLLATPMRRRDFLLSHVLARLAFVPLEAVTLLVLARFLFGVTAYGGFLDLAAVVVTGAVSFAGLGLLVASRARTMETVSGLINMATLPMILLSGVFFSTNRFPEVLQPLIRALPLTALNDALRAVMIEGASVPSLGPEFLILGLWGALSFGLALSLFRWV
jgi:ABC-2 type transport system permease protein